MPRFRYEARTPDNRHVAEELDADSAVAAISAIEERGWVVLSMVRISEDEPVLIPDNPPPSKSLAEIIAAALPKLTLLVQPLRAYAEQLPRRQHADLIGVIEMLARANSAEISADITNRPTWWLPLLAAAGEPTITSQLARFANESHANTISKDRWWWSLAYPFVVLLLALGILLALSWIVIPDFRNLLEGFGMELPKMTQMTLNFAGFLTSHEALWTVAALIVCGFLLRFSWPVFSRTSLARALIGSLPVLYGANVSRGRLARYLAQFLEAGLSTSTALPLAATATGRVRLEEAAAAVTSTHLPLYEAPKDVRALGVVTYYAISEPFSESTRVRLLQEIGVCFVERQGKNDSNRYGWLGPFGVIVLGIVVGWVAISLFLPLFKGIQGLS